MKKTLLLICVILLNLCNLCSAQTTVCSGDTALLILNTYRGTIQWQQSSDSITWDSIPGATSDTAQVIVDTTTWYRAQVIEGTCQPVYSGIKKFIINPVPAAPTATAGSGATETQITANWNASTSATTYYLDVSTVSTFTSFVIGYNNFNVGNVLTASVTGLTCDTSYYYRVRANNACGTSPNSNTITVITACIQPSCLAWFNAGSTTDGTYSIDPDGAGPVAPFNAYCDMTFDGGGWTLVAQADVTLAYNPLASVPLATNGFLNDTAYTALKAVATLGYLFVHPGTSSRFLMSPIDSVDTYSCHSMSSLMSNNSVATIWAWAWDENTGCAFVGSDYSTIVLFTTNSLSIYQLSTKQDLQIWNGTAWVTSGTVDPVGTPGVIEIWMK